MLKTREELHEVLCDILGSRKCYYQPPSNINMQYPCIVYEYDGMSVRHADNLRYLKRPRYTLTIISEDPDGRIEGRLFNSSKLPYLEEGRRYVADGLYHSPYTLYL